MRVTTGLILLAALAGCGGAEPQAGNAAANAPAAPAPPDAPVPAASAAAADTNGLAEFRADTLRGCIAGGRETAPPGAPVERHCTCAVDRVMAGRSLAALEAEERSADYDGRFEGLLRACIGEIGRQP